MTPTTLWAHVALVAAVAGGRPSPRPGEFSDAAAVHPDAADALKLVKVPRGMRIEVWATEPMLRNPVSFALDEHDRVYVAETFRYKWGVLDNRQRSEWPSDDWRRKATPERLARIEDELLDRDLAMRTVEDRAALIREFMDEKHMSTYSDQVTRIEDRDGDGRADHAVLFAGGFHDILDGIASGVLVRGGKVWLANIPHLWLLEDTTGDGMADVRRTLHTGYGVRYAFQGHDLHGLRIGPDGLLYFSVGDRGAHVKTTDGSVLHTPDTGAVFRCALDGSGLEIYATGLRNPQELIFDEHGNLFTGDNNSDGGDKARWVYVVEGGDSGWRIGYQNIETPARGPWNREKMWRPHTPGQPAFMVPPVANVASGPAGIAYHPGTGLPRSLARRFLLADFRGQNASSGVWSFSLEEHGAGFRMSTPERFVWGLLLTDLEIGWDGRLYLLDWVQGWNQPGKGRIYRLFDPAAVAEPDAVAVRRLIAEGLAKRTDAELGGLLGHPDMRVRQEAQFQLVSNRATATLLEAAARGQRRQQRLHGIWGLGQALRRAAASATRDPVLAAGIVEALARLLGDSDAEIRAQTARVLGEGRALPAAASLRRLLGDPSLRVRFFAALAAGKLGRREDVPWVMAMIRENADRDPTLRHAGVMALVGIRDVPPLLAAARDPSPAARRASLLALRRLGHAEVVRFLEDLDPSIVREASLAINDAPIDAGMSALGRLPLRGRARGLDVPTFLRVVNANFREGSEDSAQRLAAFARHAAAPEVQVAALAALGDWPAPSGRDRVTGLWRPLDPAETKRPARPAVAALAPLIEPLLRSGSDGARAEAIRSVGKLALAEAASALAAFVRAGSGRGAERAAALATLASLRPPGLAELVARASVDRSAEVRIQALRAKLLLAPQEAPDLIEKLVEKGSVEEKQVALAALAKLDVARADLLLAGWLDRLAQGRFPEGAALDLLEAAAQRPDAQVRHRLETFSAQRPQEGFDAYRETLTGGNAAAGRDVFVRNSAVQCVRCHAIEGYGGEVGPALDGIARKRDRRYLLEAVVVPNVAFAPGFESVIVTAHDGTTVGGILKKETPRELELLTPEGKPQRIAKRQVKSRDRGASGMPDGLGPLLTRRELRNLIAYLASLK